MKNSESSPIQKQLELDSELDQDAEIEPEGQGDEEIENPWDPSKIRVDPKTFSLQNVVDMINDEDLELAPPFQRKQVWGPLQKVRLIESILLRIPLPAFYFSASQDGKFQVVDGLQRLSTIRDFVANKFPLERWSLEYLQDEVGDQTYNDLQNTVWVRRIKTTQIYVNVIDPQTPDKVKFDIFKRINTSGTPLNAQEIRHCMGRQRSRDFLRTCAVSKAFHDVTAGKLDDHPRMMDRELVLRFAAFKLRKSEKEYVEAGTMDAFLTEATRKIDDDLSDSALSELSASFERAMNNAASLFGVRAFRKWPLSLEKMYPINRALFEVWSVVLSNYELPQLSPYKEQIVFNSRSMMDTDSEFIDSISTSTGDPLRVERRFTKIRKLMEESCK